MPLRLLCLFLMCLATPVLWAEAAVAESAPTAGSAPFKLSPTNRLLLDAGGKALESSLASMKGDNEAAAALNREAVALYDKILSQEPQNIKALKGRGLALTQQTPGAGQADFEQVIKLSDAAIAKDNNNAQAYYDRATAHRAMENYGTARQDYQQAIALKPDRSNWPLDLRAMEIEARGHAARK